MNWRDTTLIVLCEIAKITIITLPFWTEVDPILVLVALPLIAVQIAIVIEAHREIMAKGK